MRVLALTKYGSLAAGTRQRFMLYEAALAEAGIVVEYAPLLDNDYLERLFSGCGANWFSVARAYFARLLKLLSARKFDLLWVHYELFPFLPSFTEQFARVSGKPVIIDYDDAIFHMYDSSRNVIVRVLLGGKLEPLLRRASVCCCGNAYLKHYAERHCRKCVIIPTVVDTNIYVPAPERPENAVPVIGWIGSPSTWNYVRPLLPLLEELARSGAVRMKVVGAGVRASADRFDGMELCEWAEEREIADVQSMDIGIMPLSDEKWARGKSGYKLIQYMACALPVVTSPVGANNEIVVSGETGLFASDATEWRAALEQLISDEGLRQRLGAAGRIRVERQYSLAVHARRVVDLFKSAAGDVIVGR